MPLTRVTSNVIQDGTIIDADINASAGINMSKLGGSGPLPVGATALATNTTTQRSLSNRFADVINVKDFGATGDGIADDGPAIRAAFALANNIGNATIYFPYGKYEIKTLQTLDGLTINGFKLVGRGGLANAVLLSNPDENNLKTISVIGDSATIQSALWGDNCIEDLTNNLKLWFSIIGGGGSGAKGYAIKNNSGAIVSTVITDPGSGYTSAPTIVLDTTSSININPLGESNILGTGAQFTGTVSGGQLTGISISNPGSNYNIKATQLTFFQINGFYNISFEGISFLARSSYQPGERPIRGMFSGSAVSTSVNTSGYDYILNGNNYVNFSEIKTFRFQNDNNFNGEVAFLKSPKAGIINFENCKFQDFSQAIDCAFGKSLKVNNCFYSAKYGTGSVCSRDWTGFAFTRYGVRNVEMTNCLIYCCEEQDLTQIISQSQRQYFMQYRGCDNGILIDSQGVIKSLTVCNNKIIRNGYEAIGPIIGPPEEIQGEKNYLQVVISNNTIDSSYPIAMSGFSGGSNYGIVMDSVPGAIIANNQLLNSTIRLSGGKFPVNINPKQQGVTVNGNVLVTDNRLSYSIPGNNIAYKQNASISIEQTVVRPINANDGYNNGYFVNITNNNIVYQEYPNIGINWNGEASTFNASVTNVASTGAQIPYAIYLGGGESFANIKNNTFSVINKQLLTDFSVAFSGIGEGIIEDNTFINYDFIITGAGGTGAGYKGKFNRCPDIIRPSSNNSFLLQMENMIYPFYPTQTGWYKLEISGRRGLLADLNIYTLWRDNYGDTTNTNNNNNLVQNTCLKISSNAGYYDAPANYVVNQLSHAGNSDSPVTEFAFAGFYQTTEQYIYVNKVTEKLKLLISGGGGSGAAAYASITNGVVTSVTVTSPGTGYTSIPSVEINYFQYFSHRTVSIRGSGAIFAASVTGGGISGIAVTSGGSKYSQPIYINYTDYLASNAYGSFNSAPLTAIYLASTPDTNSARLTFRKGTQSLNLYNFGGVGGTIKVGSGDVIINDGIPSLAPDYVGQEYLNKLTNVFYKAKGTAASTDWIAIN